MANMTFDQIFTAYYSLFRADSDVPISTDDEYTVGLRLANEAINYWSNYDGVYWKELYSTNLTDGSGAQTIVTAQTVYIVPTNFREAGGFVRILDTGGNEVQRYPIIEPQEAQFKDTNSDFCYFTTSATGVFTLNINPAPSSSLNGLRIEYVYYKKPTEFTTGTDITEMLNPYFIVHRMLAMQFRASRNPYYLSALKDSENTVRTMQLDNNSGSWANPWNQADNSGTSWGE
jgi:hypothetical protein